jgi:IS5 family transposase
MKQADLGLNLTTKRTRKREFLAEMERVVPWAALVALITPYAPEGRRGRPPFPVETMLRIHFMQQWFTLSDPAMEEALHDVPLFREFAGLNWDAPLPDETTILRFRRLLEEHKLAPRILALVNELLGAKGLLLRALVPSYSALCRPAFIPALRLSQRFLLWGFGAAPGFACFACAVSSLFGL